MNNTNKILSFNEMYMTLKDMIGKDFKNVEELKDYIQAEKDKYRYFQARVPIVVLMFKDLKSCETVISDIIQNMKKDKLNHLMSIDYTVIDLGEDLYYTNPKLGIYAYDEYYYQVSMIPYLTFYEFLFDNKLKFIPIIHYAKKYEIDIRVTIYEYESNLDLDGIIYEDGSYDFDGKVDITLGKKNKLNIPFLYEFFAYYFNNEYEVELFNCVLENVG